MEEKMKRTVVGVLMVAFLAGTAWSADAPEVFTKKCKTCHSVAGVAGPMAKLGGPLDGVGAKHDEAWLKAYIENPKSKMPESKMPALKLSADELNAVVSYVSSLKTPAAK